MDKECKYKSPQDGEAGYTLVELILVIVLLSILGVFSFQILTQCLLTQRDLQVKKEKSDDTVLAMEQISRELKYAKSPINVATNDVLGFEKLIMDAANEYVLYARRIATKQMVRLSMQSTGNNVNDHAALVALSASQGEVVAQNVSTFQPTLAGSISLQFTGDTNASRQTMVYVRN